MGWHVTITSRTLDGLTLASEVTGEGQPVLLLHGWGGSMESMRRVAERLTTLGYQVHNLDLPGFGRSALPTTAWGVPEYAELVAHYLEQANVKPVNVIGHSFGGRVGIVLGADYPNSVDRIVLTDCACVLSQPTVGQQVRHAAFQAANAILSLPGLTSVDKRFRGWARNPYASEDLRNAGLLEPIFRVVIRQDLLPYAARIKASTFLIWGDQDTETPLWQGQRLEKTIPDAGLVVFKGAGHFAYLERLADFVHIVDTFLKRKQ